MTDEGPEPVQLRPGWYDEPAASARPAPISSARPQGARVRRRFRLGEHPLAEVEFAVAGSFALVGWLAAGALIFSLVDQPDAPEAMAGLAVAFGMPPVLLVAFGSSAMAAFVWHRCWGERTSLILGITAVVAAVLAPCTWIAVVW